MTKTHVSAELLAAMGDLLSGVRGVTFDFDTPGAEQSRVIRDEVADQLSDYILPRLVQLDAPLLTVVGGSTGAGKSTLVNSIVGSAVTEAGVLRPTTRSPVLVHHPDDAEWFGRDRILPDLPRRGEADAPDGYGLRLVATRAVPAGLAILDAPDVDSVDQINRELATQLLAAADLWLFVTSAARYADQVPWSYLKRAADRSTSLAVVLDRTAPEAIEEVRGHLARMMTSRGLAESPLFTVPEGPLSHSGLLPADAVGPIAAWLRDLAANPDDRRRVVGRTLDGAVRHLVFRAHDVADAVDEQIDVARKLGEPVQSTFAEAEERLRRSVTNSSMFSGEVQSRWAALVDEGLPTAVRDRVLRNQTVPGSFDLVEAVASAVKVAVVSGVDRAVHEVTRAWAGSVQGRRLLASKPDADRISAATRARADELGDAWAVSLVNTITDAAAELDVDPNALVACAAMATIVEQRRAQGHPHQSWELFAEALGSDTANRLVDLSVATLVDGATELLMVEKERLKQLAPDVDTIVTQQDVLRDAARAAEYARHTDFIHGEIAP